MLLNRILAALVITGSLAVASATASAATTIDATRLTSDTFALGHATFWTGRIPAQEPRELALPPATYELYDAADNVILFTVDAAGNVSYPAFYDSFLQGRGTTTLTVIGHQVTIDAHELSAAQWSLRDLTDWFDRSSKPVLTVIPGSHYFFQNLYIAPIGLQVDNDGKWRHDPSYDDFLDGRGTANLIVHGFEVSIVGPNLSAPYHHIEGLGNLPVHTGATYRVIPAQYYITSSSTEMFVLATVDHNGRWSYDPALEPVILDGAGSTHLTIHGARVKVDARALSSPFWLVGYALLEWVPREQTAEITVLPGRVYFVDARQSYSNAMRVSAAGTWAYAEEDSAWLDGAGTSTLVVVGYPFTVDGWGLAEAGISSFSLFPGQVLSTFQEHTFAGIPGNLYAIDAGGASLAFTIDGQGLFQNAPPSFLGVPLAGNGTSALLFGTRPAPDEDDDGVLNDGDNCPSTPNPDQGNADGDSLGDACDEDDDDDTVLDVSDNCVTVANGDQLDTDDDAQGDACDGDDDADGRADGVDNCALAPNPDQADLDDDGEGDACDGDDDGDGVSDLADNCPVVGNAAQADQDGDGKGDACEGDDDDDGVEDGDDNCVTVVNEDQHDLDGDGQGDACDADDDNDLILDAFDNCPTVYNPVQSNSDQDTYGNACEPDRDRDGVIDDLDNCPDDADPSQANADRDARGDICDLDDDGDGIDDAADNCPLKSNRNQSDIDGDDIGDACDARFDVGRLEDALAKIARRAIAIVTSVPKLSQSAKMISILNGVVATVEAANDQLAAGRLSPWIYRLVLADSILKLEAFEKLVQQRGSAPKHKPELSASQVSALRVATLEMQVVIGVMVASSWLNDLPKVHSPHVGACNH